MDAVRGYLSNGDAGATRNKCSACALAHRHLASDFAFAHADVCADGSADGSAIAHSRAATTNEHASATNTHSADSSATAYSCTTNSGSADQHTHITPPTDDYTSTN